MNKLIEEVKEKLSKLLPVVGILLTGSYARETIYQDVDLLVLIKKISTEDFISMAMHELGCLSTTCIRSDDALQFPTENSYISIAVHQDDLFLEYINSFITGVNIDVVPKTWAIGGRLPEVVCFDVVTGKILFDPVMIFERLQDQLRFYPLLAKKALIKKCHEEIELRLTFVKNKKDGLSSLLAGNELLLPLIRLVFARKEIFLPGTKRLLDDVRICFGDSNEFGMIKEIVERQSILDPLIVSRIYDFLNNLE